MTSFWCSMQDDQTKNVHFREVLSHKLFKFACLIRLFHKKTSQEILLYEEKYEKVKYLYKLSSAPWIENFMWTNQQTYIHSSKFSFLLIPKMLFPKNCFSSSIFFSNRKSFLWKISPKLQKLVHLWQRTSQERAVSSPECPIYIFPIILLSVSVLPGDSRNSAAIVSRS